MTRPWLYVDLDDVLCQTTPALAALHARRGGASVALDAMHSFDLRISLGLDEAEYARFMRAAHAPEFLASLPPVPGAARELAAWAAGGFAIAVVTGRPPSSEAATRRWLAARGLPHDALYIVDKYGHQDWRAGERAAAQPALSRAGLAALGFALALEDSLAMAHHLAGTLAVPVLLVDRPWNRQPEPASPGAPITRIAALADATPHVLRLAAAHPR